LILEIIYQDEKIVAINKPHGLLVHKTKLANDARVFALQELRNQLGQHVYPVHRLDRKTSGVLLFALNPKVQSEISELFREGKVEKTYNAIVRGYLKGQGIIDYELTNGKGKIQSALTHYKPLTYFEIKLPFGKHNTSRYTLVELNPKTGRFHQLRKHMAHIFYPILGDRPHGCNKQNKLWKQKFNMDSMMLHAKSLSFEYPTGNLIAIDCYCSSEMNRVLDVLANF